MVLAWKTIPVVRPDEYNDITACVCVCVWYFVFVCGTLCDAK